MALGAIEGNRTCPFDSGGAGKPQALHSLGCDRTQSISSVRLGWHGIPSSLRCDQSQSNSPVRLGWCGTPGSSWPLVQSKAINLICSTQVAQNPTHFMALVRLKAIELTRSTREARGLGWHGIPGASWLWVRSKAIELTQVVQDLRPWVRSTSIDLICSTRVARNPRHFMALGAIEGNQTHQFGLGSTDR